jgi:hypothetical protein
MVYSSLADKEIPHLYGTEVSLPHSQTHASEPYSQLFNPFTFWCVLRYK